MMMRLAIPALLLLTGCDSGAGRDEEKTAATAPDGYREAAAALDTAIAAKDAAALEKLIADDFLWVRGSGEKGDKAGFIAALTAPAIKIEPFQPSEARWIVTRDSALLTATNTLRGSADGDAFVDRHRFADHWVWRDGGWRLVLAQITPHPIVAPKSAAPAKD